MGYLQMRQKSSPEGDGEKEVVNADAGGDGAVAKGAEQEAT